MQHGNELHVQQYDPAAAAAKRNKILIRVGIGVGIAAAAGVLGYFGLTALQNMLSPGPFVVGGSGSWYASVVVHPDAADG